LLGTKREFWWDELDRLLLQPGSLPETLRLSINGRSYQWELGEAAHYNPLAYERQRSWRAWENAPGFRQALYRSLYDLLQPLLADERREVLDDILMWADAKPPGRATHRSLLLNEVVDLMHGDLVEAGAHTVTHPDLYSLPATLQRKEIEGSKAHLEQLLNRPVTSFAYPHGMPSNYTAETQALVRDAGFIRACSAFEGIVEKSTDWFQLPRCSVEDWDGEEFTKRLLRWFDSGGQQD